MAHDAGIGDVQRLGHLGQDFIGKLFSIILGAVAKMAGFGIINGHSVVVGDPINNRKPRIGRVDGAGHKLDQVVIGQP